MDNIWEVGNWVIMKYEEDIEGCEAYRVATAPKRGDWYFEQVLVTSEGLVNRLGRKVPKYVMNYIDKKLIK